MKRYILISILLLIILLPVGCSNNDDSLNDNEDSEFQFQFKVDGTEQKYIYGDNQVNLTGSYGYNGNIGVYSINIAGSKNIFESGTNTLTIFIGDTREFSKGINISNIPISRFRWGTLTMRETSM